MKSRITLNKSLSLKSALVLGVLVNTTLGFAQYGGDTLMSDTDQYLNQNSGSPYNSDQIDVGGRFNKLDKMRRKLEKKNQQMVRKKIENVRMKNETKLTKQLQGAFSGQGFNAGSGQASQVVKAAPSVTNTALLGTRMMVKAGAMAFSGEQHEIESKAALSIGFEGDLSARVSYGIAFTYVKADLVDDTDLYANGSNYVNSGYYNNNNNYYNNSNYYNNNNYNNNNNQYYGSNYTSVFGEGREMSYSQMGIETNAKFYFTRTNRFAPYFGLGLSISRSKLSYNDNQDYSYNGTSFGNELYKSNSFAGSAMLGANINFTHMFGANIELKGGKGFGTFGQGDNDKPYRSIDEYRLENFGNDIEHALFLGATLGLFVQF